MGESMQTAADACADRPDRRSNSRNLADFIKRFAYTTCLLTPLIALAEAIIHLRQGWDDGAITVAFSRTFHLTGKIALTPYSEVVEGFSSLSWMLILSYLDTFSHSVYGMLAFSKIASAVAYGLSLLVFARLSRRFLAAELRYLAVALMALLITPFCEVINGMEMNFYMLLVLALTETMLMETARPWVKWVCIIVLSNAILLTRFESPFLLFFLYVGMFLYSRKIKAVAILVLGNVISFGLSEIWRYRLFGQWLPNTIIAKRWPPYSTHLFILGLISRFGAAAEIVFVLALPLLALVALSVVAATSRKAKQALRKTEGISLVLLSMTIGAFMLALAMGRNWGHPGRMYLGFLPFALLAVVSACRSLLERAGLSVPKFVAVMMACQALLWMAEARVLAFRLTPYGAVERVGLAADQLRSILHQDTLSAFIPDVGGSALCCEKLNIMDSALLANKSLAHEGYAGTAAFLRTNRPDAIGTHDPWANLSGLYKPHGLDGYKEVEVRGERLFVREDLYAYLSTMEFSKMYRGVDKIPCVSSQESALLAPDDRNFLASQPECLLISR